ncbi:helix-turn-helix domain-containing protein [Pseudonocardia alni]|uniref:helix-turn-helix domain-containing protein n=1 Tax=Pseudonocardia alni TaxID=33907 RepID=UPI00331B6BA7
MTAPPATRRTRTVRECAEEIGVSTDVVRDWIRSGQLAAKFCGNKYLVLDRTLQAFIESFGDAHDGVA